jgi:glycosyltransferase involved in cell wall biosynthesis
MVAHTLRGDKGLPLRERGRRVFGHGIAEALAGRGAVRVAVSETAAAEVARYYRLPVHEVIPNGVNTRLFAPRDRIKARARFQLHEGIRYALFVGRAETRKGADLLRPACEEAGWKLLVAGAEIEGGRSLGTLRQEELADAYSAADAVLFPTRYEACSYVVLEALACGTPVVTTEVGWICTLLKHVPEYRSLIANLSVDSLVAVLDAATRADRSVITRAREFVLANNDLETFAAHWRELAERTIRT